MDDVAMDDLLRPIRSVTAEEIAAFREDGVVCLRGVIDPAAVAAMAGPVEAALAGPETADMAALGDALAASGTSVVGTPAGRGGFRSGVDHWRTRPEFRRFAIESPVPALVAALMGSPIVRLYEDSVLSKEPGTGYGTAWHQDLSYFNLDGDHLVTTWIPLDVATAESGAMRFVRGSHRWNQVFRPNLFVSDETLPGTDGEPVPDIDHGEVVDPADVIAFDLGPGDLTVHHARTLHAAGPNRSDRRRRALSIRYCGDDARFLRRPGTVPKDYQRQLSDGDVLPEAECPTCLGPSAGS